MPSIFLDASALVPMVVTRDQWRPSLLRVMEGLRRAGHPSFVTTNWTLYEALALCRRSSHEIAMSLLAHSEAQMRITTVSGRTEAEAIERFRHRAEQTASVVDHANLLVAMEARCEAILSFDSDFKPIVRAAGLRLLD